MPQRFYCRLSMAMALALISLGCGSDGPELGGVSGIVTLDGLPVPDAYVVFTPQGPGRPSQTKTDEQGRFTLQFSGSDEGALVGTHNVTVSTADITDEGENVPELIPAKYNTQGSIEVTVTSGSNDVPIELTGGEIVQPHDLE